LEVQDPYKPNEGIHASWNPRNASITGHGGAVSVCLDPERGIVKLLFFFVLSFDAHWRTILNSDASSSPQICLSRHSAELTSNFPDSSTLRVDTLPSFSIYHQNGKP